MDAKLAKYLHETAEDLKTRAKDILFVYESQNEDENTEQLLEDMANYIEDVQDLLHHLAIV